MVGQGEPTGGNNENMVWLVCFGMFWYDKYLKNRIILNMVVCQYCKKTFTHNYVLTKHQKTAKYCLKLLAKEEELAKQNELAEVKTKEDEMRGWLYGSLFDLAIAFVRVTGFWPQETDRSQWI